MNQNKKLIQDFKRFLHDKNKSTSTVTAYITDISQLASSIDRQFSEITAENIQEFLKTAGSKKTQARKLNSIKSFFSFLIINKVIEEDPSEQVKYPKIGIRKQRILSKAEYQQLISKAKGDKKIFTILSLFIQTGMKIGELTRLKVSDVEIKDINAEIRIAAYESGETRKISLNDKMLFILKDYIYSLEKGDQERQLFTTSNNTPIQDRNLRNSVRKYFNLCNLKDCSINDLRNTFIVSQLKAGNSLEFVAHLVGHKSTVTTRRYLKFVKNYKAKRENRIVEL